MESRPPKVKLSKYLLEMKFMKRSALRLEKEAHNTEQQQHIDEVHWVLDLPGMQKHQSKYVAEPSIVTCKQLMFGRMAFRNFNPDIEKLMKLKNSEHDLAEAEEREKELGVSDVEMATRYSSLVGTVGKKFTRKRKRVSESDSVDGGGEESTQHLGVNTVVQNSSALIDSTLAQIRKETESSTYDVTVLDRQEDSVNCLNKGSATKSSTPEGSSNSAKTSRKAKKSPAVLDYYKKKSKGFMKPSDKQLYQYMIGV